MAREGSAPSPRREAEQAVSVDPRSLDLLRQSPGADDERAELPEDDVDCEADAQMETATRQSCHQPGAQSAPLGAELARLEEMATIATRSRYDADTRVRHLVAWIRRHLCPDLGRERS